MLTMKDAAEKAREQIIDLFGREEIRDLGLEEVWYEPQESAWCVTIGFSRPWERKDPIGASLYEKMLARSYKTVGISQLSENVLWVKDRILKGTD